MKRLHIAVLVVACLSVLMSAADRPSYDGEWWKKQWIDRKDGFIAGADDCFSWEHNPPVELRFCKGSEARELLDDFYRVESRSGTLVVEALQSIRGQKCPPPAPGVEVWDEPHGYFDGMWWTGAPPGQKERGFLEGFIACLPNGQSQYPKAIDYYVKAVDEWYATGPVDREYEKIATVLSKFRTPPEAR